jgi:leishmanolysin-like peptidase
LEDQGEDGTILTHWEKRVFEVRKHFVCLIREDLKFTSDQNEAMTGTHTQNPVYSRITLALMEDTG